MASGGKTEIWRRWAGNHGLPGGEKRGERGFSDLGLTNRSRERAKGLSPSLAASSPSSRSWPAPVDSSLLRRPPPLQPSSRASPPPGAAIPQQGTKTNLIKESIRMGYNDIGDFYYGHGHLSEAFKSYIRTRDYCTTSKHVVQMCMHVILVSIQLGQFTHVTNYVSKAEQTPDTLEPVIIAKLRAAAGLAYLETKKYKLAARKFLETGPELGNNYSEVIAPQDVAVYGALCALASFDRSDLKSKVIDNINFRNFLELVPEVRELVNDFYSSRYGSCLEHLEKLKPNLLLDIHLHEHLEALYKDIRHKAIIQYTLPFISVDLNTMADAFKTSVSMLEKELAALITDNKIKARIDSHNKILYARHADQRNATFQRALQTGSEFERDVKAMLLRANLMKHDFNQRNAPRKM